MTSLDELSARMDRMEGALTRITELLEERVPPARGALTTQAEETRARIAAVHGDDEVTERLADLMLQLGDPEVLGSLTRIVALAPKLEYAAYFAAAGPELLEEAMEATNHTIMEAGFDPHEAQLRATRAAETLVGLSDRKTLDVARRMSGLAPAYLPLMEAAASALEQRTEHEGADELQGRMVDAMLQLSDPDIQEALVRIATLAPKLEYAAYFAAAGPELLEEAMEMVQHRSAQLGVDPRVISHRLAQATDLLFLFTGSAQVTTLREFGRRAPDFLPVMKASSDVLAQRAEIEGSELERRLRETVLELSDPETLESLVRIAQLAPKLEYAAYFAAAGPELLEEAMHGVQQWAATAGVEGVDARAGAALEALVTLTTPATLRGLAGVSKTLAQIAVTEDASESLQRLVTRLPRLEKTVQLVERSLDLVDAAAQESGFGELESLREPAVSGLRLLHKATQPENLHALEVVLELAPDLARFAEPVLRRMTEMRHEDVSEMMELLITPRMLDLARELDSKHDDLKALLEAVSLEPGTIKLLRAAQGATASAASAPQRPVGVWGLWKALRDPDVQRALGLGVTLAGELSARLDGQDELMEPRAD